MLGSGVTIRHRRCGAAEDLGCRLLMCFAGDKSVRLTAETELAVEVQHVGMF